MNHVAAPVATANIAPANTAQATAWDGPEGEQWTTDADRYEAASRRYDPHLITAAHLRADSAVLDIGCGSGVSGRDAATVATAGRVLGIDLSTQLLNQAHHRSQAAGLLNTEFVHSDAQVHPFPPGTFDVVISRFGAMFFADPAAAFANIGAALRPDGRLALLAWRHLADNEWVSAVREVLAVGRLLPDPPPDAPGPFGLADPDHVRDWLTRAGYTDLRLDRVDESMYLGADADDAVEFVSSLGLARGLLNSLPPEPASRALHDLQGMLAAHATADGVLFGSSAWLITATRDR